MSLVLAAPLSATCRAAEPAAGPALILPKEHDRQTNPTTPWELWLWVIPVLVRGFIGVLSKKGGAAAQKELVGMSKCKWEVEEHKTVNASGKYAWLTTAMMMMRRYCKNTSSPFKYISQKKENAVMQDAERKTVSVFSVWEEVRKTVKYFPVYQAL